MSAFYPAILFLFLLGLPAPVLSQDIGSLDIQYGLFGVKLGTHIDSLSGFERKGRYQKKTEYIRPDRREILGPAQLSEVTYLFHRKQLHSIRIRTKGDEQSDAVLDFLQTFYGTGKRPTASPRITWNGKRIVLVYEKNLLTHNAEILLISKDIDRLFRKDYHVMDGY